MRSSTSALKTSLGSSISRKNTHGLPRDVGGTQVISPAQIPVYRYRSVDVVATKPGYQTASTTLHSDYSWATYADLVLIAPFCIDLLTHSVYAVSPDKVNLVLEPSSEGASYSSK